MGLVRASLMSAVVVGVFSISMDHPWHVVLIGSIGTGLYIPSAMVSATTLAVAWGDTLRAWDPQAQERAYSFHAIYREHKSMVLGTTILAALCFGGGLGLWIHLHYSAMPLLARFDHEWI